MADNFENTIHALMNGIDEHISTKSIIGAPIEQGDTVIFPMADVTFGIAAGSFVQEKKNNGTGGVGAKMTPSAILVIQNGNARIINIKDKESINKLIELIPDLLEKVKDIITSKADAGVQEAPAEAEQNPEEPAAE